MGVTENEKFEVETKEEIKLRKKKEKENRRSFIEILHYNRPEWIFILFGSISSFFSGGIQPAFGVTLSKTISLFSLCTYDEQRERITINMIIFGMLGFASLLGQTLSAGMFSISGERLTERLRSRAFKTMLSQEVEWFDDKNNNVGALTTKLATEASAVQGASGVRLGFALQIIGNLGIGIIVSFVYSWPIALLILAFIPLLVLSGAFQMKLITGFATKDNQALIEAGKITNESIGNIRTVAMLTKEDYFREKYLEKIALPYKASLKSSHINGFMVGLTNSILFYAIAAGYNLGSYLITNNKFGTSFEDVMIVFNCMVFGAQQVGQMGSFMPDHAKAKSSAASLFQLFERIPLINNWDEGNGERLPDKYDTCIKVKNVNFTYPSRPDAQILKELSLTIKEGQRVALVGSSGCGKSTITQLIERFYNPDSGELTLNNKKLSDLNLHWLRSQIGIVSQEPILFDLTIQENIAYGDNSREVSIEVIYEAAKKANIHDFITALPRGYRTNVGAKGTQLSGGQKQRIAIARSLIRDPKILLLDEATSSLDTESEKIVQDALEKAQKGRTCIIIAHRLSTIKTCDLIFVIKEGQVLEKGTHDELIELNGFYSKLYNQS